MRFLLWTLLGVTLASAQPVPFYSRSQTSNQDAGAGNANLRDITGRRRDNLVPIVGDVSCGPSQALLGASEKQGYIFGGTCATVQTGAPSSTVTTSSPITGDGSTGSPVTLSKAVPNNLIDLSTVTSALSGKAAVFTGISSGCAAGYYLSSGTWVNGIQTGGGCVSVQSAARYTFYFSTHVADVSTFFQMTSTVSVVTTTATFTGVVNGVVLSTYTTLPGVPQLNEIPEGLLSARMHLAQTAGTQNVTAFAEFREATSTGGMGGLIVQTNSTPNLSSTLTPYDVSASLSSPYLFASTSSRVLVRIVLNTNGGGSSPTVQIYSGGVADSRAILPGATADASRFVPYNGSITDVDLGSNGLKSDHETVANGLTASSGTFLATGQYSLLTSSGEKISAGTLTLNDFANGSSTRCVHVNADGSLTPSSADCGTGSGGGGSSTMTITAVSDNFLGQVTGSLKTFTLSNTPANAAALTCVLDGLLLSQTSDYTYAAPTTITVTTAPAANSTGFFCNYFVNTSTLPAAFILTSTQSVTGSTTFLGAVHASSGSHVTFPSTLAYTTPQASFLASVTGSTISFTVQGTTVACWTSGSVGSNGTSFINLGIMVDGSVSFIPGTSSTVGIFDQNNQGSGSCMGIGTYNEFQVTGGGASHTFSIGFWSPAPNTETFPCNSTSKSISQFGCREVLSQ